MTKVGPEARAGFEQLSGLGLGNTATWWYILGTTPSFFGSFNSHLLRAQSVFNVFDPQNGSLLTPPPHKIMLSSAIIITRNK